MCDENRLQAFFFDLQHPPVIFYIDNLEPGYFYRVIIFAVNAKGRSEPTIIDDISFKGVAKFTGKTKIKAKFYKYFRLVSVIMWHPHPTPPKTP